MRSISRSYGFAEDRLPKAEKEDREKDMPEEDVLEEDG